MQVRKLAATLAAVVGAATLSLSATAQDTAKAPAKQETKTGKVQVDAKIPEYKAVQGVNGTVKSIGSDSMINLMTAWGEDFKKLYPSVKVEIEGKGSATAPPALIDNQAQFGPMSRPMKGEEISAFERKFGYKPTELRAGIDALAVFVHKDNPLEEITPDQIKKLFSVAGPDMTWGDLGVKGDLAAQPVTLYGRNSASGTYGFFKEHALAKADYKANVKEQPGSSAVVQAVGTDRTGIGYSGIGYMTADIKVLKIKKPDGKVIIPSYETALSGQYPLARFLIIYVNKNPNESLDPLRAEFIKFMFSKAGQETVIKDGYFPVTPKIAADELKKAGL